MGILKLCLKKINAAMNFFQWLIMYPQVYLYRIKEYIKYLSYEANKECHNEGKKTIQNDFIYKALKVIIIITKVNIILIINWNYIKLASLIWRN